MTQKVIGVIEMTYLYDDRCSFVLLRPKNEVKLPTQSALGQIWLGNGLYQIGGIFHHVVMVRFVPEFFPNTDGFAVLGKLTPVHNGRGGGGKRN